MVEVKDLETPSIQRTVPRYFPIFKEQNKKMTLTGRILAENKKSSSSAIDDSFQSLMALQGSTLLYGTLTSPEKLSKHEKNEKSSKKMPCKHFNKHKINGAKTMNC